MEFNMTETGYTMTTDFGTIAISGDATKGFKPGELLVSAVVICSAGVLRQVLKKMRIDVKNLDVEVKEIGRVEEEGNRIEKIHFHFTVDADQLTEKKLEKAIEVSTKNCAMAQTVKNSVELVKTFTII